MTEEGQVERFRKSLRHALRGLSYVAKNERNFQIELAVALVILLLIFILKLENWEAVILLLLIAGVLIAELGNTVVERVVDILKPRIHPYARLIKDIMAATVLISSIAAVMIGLIIFLPYIKEFIR